MYFLTIHYLIFLDNELKKNNPYLKMVGVGTDPFQQILDQQSKTFPSKLRFLVDMMPG